MNEHAINYATSHENLSDASKGFLSVRAANILLWNRIPEKKDEVRRAIESGLINNKLRGLGKKTLTELCVFAGMQKHMPSPLDEIDLKIAKKYAEIERIKDQIKYLRKQSRIEAKAKSVESIFRSVTGSNGEIPEYWNDLLRAGLTPMDIRVVENIDKKPKELAAILGRSVARVRQLRGRLISKATKIQVREILIKHKLITQ